MNCGVIHKEPIYTFVWRLFNKDGKIHKCKVKPLNEKNIELKETKNMFMDPPAGL